MRYLLCVIGGLLIGAMVALTFANAMQRRNAWPRALMTVMQHELGAAREAARANPCNAPVFRSASEHLSLLSADIEPAMLEPGSADRVFSQYAGDLHTAIGKMQAADSCAAQAEAATLAKQACDACHRDYR